MKKKTKELSNKERVLEEVKKHLKSKSFVVIAFSKDESGNTVYIDGLSGAMVVGVLEKIKLELIDNLDNESKMNQLSELIESMAKKK